MEANTKVADHLFLVAKLMEQDGQKRFQCLAFSKAALTIRDYLEDVSKINPRTIPGVGTSVGTCIEEFLKTGTSHRYEDLKTRWSPEVLSMIAVPGIGPKKAYKLYEQGIKNLDELKAAAERGELDEKLTNAVKFATSKEQARIPLPIATQIGEQLLEKVLKLPGIYKAQLCGSLRRGLETIKDIDIVACLDNDSLDPESRYHIMAEFAKFGELVVSGDTKTSIRVAALGEAVQADLWLVEEWHWGAALNYATGSKEHNKTLRGIARKHGYTVNEYGIFIIGPDGEADRSKRVGGEHEEDLYNILKLPYHPPELREAQLWSKVPELITAEDVKFDGHCHTYWSPDGDTDRTILGLVQQAKQLGYDFIAVTDHSYSQHFRVTDGKDKGKSSKPFSSLAIKEYIKECRDAEQKVGIRVLAGVECDILADGELQWPAEYLKLLDFALGAIHRQHNENVTARYVKAMESGLIDALAHPMTRKFGARPAADADWDLVIATALRTGCALEVNGGYDRLDLEPGLAYKAAEAGVRLILSSDSHSSSGMDAMRYAITIARRAGLTKEHLFTPRGK